MNIFCFNPVYFEKWRWDTPDTRGIGGSETAAVELCARLAQRGHNVTCYVPLSDEDRDGGIYRGTQFRDLDDADFTAPGIWIIFRDAECIDRIPHSPDHRIWLLCQDESPRNLTAERAAKCERVIALCQWHKRYLERRHPYVKGKVCVTSNGIKCDLIRQTEAAGVPNRNPHRLIYASSPDRGLLPLLKIFKRAREFVPDLELHCFYGTDNIEKLIEFAPQFKHYTHFLADLKKGLDQPGVHWHGRVSQERLRQETFASGIWCYPCSGFSETSCITSMEMQAMGAIPITCPRAALAENVTHGVFIEGDAHGDSLTRARYVYELVRLCWCPQVQDEIRSQMMAEARARFNWERQVDQLEGWLYGWEARMHVAQFAFQLKHATGRVLNVGCADDPAGLGERGVNLDVMTDIPWTGKKTRADVIADFRQTPPLIGTFDTVVLGDILEHLGDEDAVRMLENARAVLNPGGKVVITCPEDYRPADRQHAVKGCKYPQGESAYHERPITRDILDGWLDSAGLNATRVESIDYTNFMGWGIVAEPIPLWALRINKNTDQFERWNGATWEDPDNFVRWKESSLCH